jgi:hypothetical protein
MNKIDKLYTDLIGDVHKEYVKTSEPMLDGKYLSQPEFIYWLKTDDEFAKRWGVTIETKELTEDERINLLHIKHGNKGHHIEAGFNMLDEFDIPTKVIRATYKNKTIENYE